MHLFPEQNIILCDFSRKTHTYTTRHHNASTINHREQRGYSAVARTYKLDHAHVPFRSVPLSLISIYLERILAQSRMMGDLAAKRPPTVAVMISSVCDVLFQICVTVGLPSLPRSTANYLRLMLPLPAWNHSAPLLSSPLLQRPC